MILKTVEYMFFSAEDSSAGINRGKIGSGKSFGKTSILSSTSEGDRHIWLVFSLLFFALVWGDAMYSQNIQDIDWEITSAKTTSPVQGRQAKVKGAEDENIKVTEWKEYKDKYLGFSVKYPATWLNPKKERISRRGKFPSWKVSFQNSFGADEDSKGFDVVFYEGVGYLSSEKSNEISVRDEASDDYRECGDIIEPTVIGKNYSGYKIEIDKGNECFEEAYFFSLSRGGSLYDIVPHLEKEISHVGYDGEKQTKKGLNSFYQSLESFKYIGRITAVKRHLAPRITAPKPSAEVKIVSGKRKCAKKNDKPRKSKDNKKKHMDMECCLDPGEIPNPWCSY